VTGKVAPVLCAALIGCGRRGTQVYLPTLRAMRDHFRLVAVCDRDARRADEVAGALGVRGYHDVDELLARERPDICVISVSAPPSPAKGSVLRRCVDGGCPALAETPIALTLDEGYEIAAVAARRSVPVEVGENYWRTRSSASSGYSCRRTSAPCTLSTPTSWVTATTASA
jgi:predicted dehydrogenase